MSEYKPLQNIAYDYLREMIYSREMKFGVIYSETRLAGRLSISRTPIRDALNRLNRERYIDILPNRGFQLHKPNKSEIWEAYHIRMMIECYCGDMLARSHQTREALATLDSMREHLDHQARLLEYPCGVDLRQFWLEDQELHFTLLHYLNISAFNMQYDSFMHIFMPQHLNDAYVLGRNHSTITEHREIIEALSSGDTARTRRAIEEHLNTSLRLSLKNIEQPEHARP